jgi:IS4 transposase
MSTISKFHKVSFAALLYKSRWDVEKVFDELKNKLGETKS